MSPEPSGRVLDFLDSARAQLEQADRETDEAMKRALIGRGLEDMIGAVWSLTMVVRGGAEDLLAAVGADDPCRRPGCAHDHARHRVGGACRDCGCGEFLREDDRAH